MILFILHDLAPSLLSASACATVILSTPLDTPIKNVVVLVALTDEEIAEELAEVRIIGLVVETEGTGVVEEDPKLVGEAAAEKISGGSHLLLHDTIVFLLLGSSFEALPRKSAAQEIHEHVCERFKVITTGLFDTQMGVDRGVTSRTSQVLVLPVRNMEMSLWVTELLRETEIDDVDLIATLADTHKEVVWFDIPMDEVARVDVFNARDLRIKRRSCVVS